MNDNLVNDTISRQAAIDAVRKAKDKSEAHRMLVQLPSAQPGCVDAVPRTSVEYICRKNTVSTNPYEHKYHDKFMQFMDDPEISDFGRWEHSNGFNTALVAVKCDLDKVPSVTPKQPGWIPWDTNTRKSVVDTLMMLYRLAYNIHGVMDVIDEDNIKRLSRWLEGEEP